MEPPRGASRPLQGVYSLLRKNALRWRMSHDLDATGTHRGVVRSCNRTMHASHTHAASAGVFRLRWLV